MICVVGCVLYLRVSFLKTATGSLRGSIHAASNDPNKVDNLGNDKEPKENHGFNKVQEMLYNRAIQFPGGEQAPVRQPFTLDGWDRGSGGLDDDDRKLLGEIYFKANSVFEYGLGESTYIAAAVGVPRYAGVDSDPAWVVQARTKANMSHFRFSFADIGSTGNLGYPKDSTLQKIQYNYQVAPLQVENAPFDVYLVDGRYRVASACVCLLHAMSRGGDMEKVLVGIHDNDMGQRGYLIFVGVADIVEKRKKLWVYKIKPGTTEEDIIELWKMSEKIQTRH